MQTFRQYLNGLNIIQASLAIGVSLFTAVVLFVNWDTWVFRGDELGVFVPVVIGVALISFSLAVVVYARLTAKAARQTVVRDKLYQFRTAVVVRAALIEGPSLFALVVALITSQWMYLIVAAIGLAFLSNNFVTADKLRDRLHFSPEQREEVDRPEFRV